MITDGWVIQNPAGAVPILTADGKLYGDTVATIEFMINLSCANIPRRTGLTQAVHDDSRDPNFILRSAVISACRLVYICSSEPC
jgi:hypothetical protein